MMSLGIGMRQSLDLFLLPVTHDLRLKAADFTFAVAVQNVAWGVFEAPVGAIGDKRLRSAMMTGGWVDASDDAERRKREIAV